MSDLGPGDSRVVLDADQISKLQTQQIAALSTAQIASLSSDDLNALSSTQFAALSSAQAGAITSSQAAAMTTEDLAAMTHHELMLRAGAEAVELIMWLVMRGAMSDKTRCVHRHYYAPMTTGMGLITFEE